MTPLHVAPSDAPEKQLATTWTVEGVSIRALWSVCEVAFEVLAYYCWMTRICPFLWVKGCHNVCCLFQSLSWQRILSESFMEPST